MTTRLIRIAALILLLAAPGLPHAAETAATAPTVTADAGQPPAESRDRLGWQRVGSPEETAG